MIRVRCSRFSVSGFGNKQGTVYREALAEAAGTNSTGLNADGYRVSLAGWKEPTKKPCNDFHCRALKLVAGAGFEPTTFRL